MRVLSVASEVFPLIKTGGLADVAGALPLALSGHGIAVKTLLPGYPAVLGKLEAADKVLDLDDVFGAAGRLLAATAGGLDLLILDLPDLFDRDGGPYTDGSGKDYPDNWRRFAALSRVAADIAAGALAGWTPALVHAHDWQAGMAPVFMRFGGASAVPSVMTVHNLAFQGQFAASIFADLGLPPAAFTVHGVEYYGDVGFLKGGLQAANAITTVSPTYAQEIRTPEFGMGLDGLINTRAGDLHGIVNGIDTAIWDPANDPLIASPFTPAKLKARQANRAALAARFGIEADGDPLFSVVSRLTWQKGIDILVEAIEGLVAAGGKLAVLGAGDQALEGALLSAAARHRGRVGIVIGYDEALSHRMQAGADAILIPSRFEPCGLTQLCALRYGSVPIVARTGGLADTVIDANEAALSSGVATGFQFTPVNADGLAHAIRRALAAWRQPKVWARLQSQGMKADVSWARSAARYAELYRSLAA